VTVLKSTFVYVSIHGKTKKIPGPRSPVVKTLPKRNITALLSIMEIQLYYHLYNIIYFLFEKFKINIYKDKTIILKNCKINNFKV
jgi:hypothetical protein